MQIKGNLDNSNTIIINVLFIPTSQANQDTKKEDLAN
jgi:hypothetical protein